MSAVRRWPKSEVTDPLSSKVARTVGNSMASNMASKAKAATIMLALSKGNGRADHRVSSGTSNKAINRALRTISLQADRVSRVITL